MPLHYALDRLLRSVDDIDELQVLVGQGSFPDRRRLRAKLGGRPSSHCRRGSQETATGLYEVQGLEKLVQSSEAAGKTYECAGMFHKGELAQKEIMKGTRHEYELYMPIEEIDHTRTKTKSPQTNGSASASTRR